MDMNHPALTLQQYDDFSKGIGFIGQRFGGVANENDYISLVSYFEEVLAEYSADLPVYVATGVGTDLAFLNAAKNLRRTVFPVVPFPSHTNRWPSHLRALYYDLTKGLEPEIVVSPEHDYRSYDRRNLFIARHAISPLLTFWDGVSDRGFGRLLATISYSDTPDTVRNLAQKWRSD